MIQQSRHFIGCKNSFQWRRSHHFVGRRTATLAHSGVCAYHLSLSFPIRQCSDGRRGGKAFSVDYKFDTPFDNIEGAQEYLALLSEALDEAKQTAESDIARESNSPIARRRDALRLVLYKLEKLEQHIKTSRRLLNDLRTLRRLLLEERSEPAVSKHAVNSKR